MHIFEEHRALVDFTGDRPNLTTDFVLLNAALGLCGEVGEVLQQLYNYEDRSMDVDIFAKELGDVMWYVQYMFKGLEMLGVTNKYCSMHQLLPSLIPHPPFSRRLRSIFVCSSLIADEVKKYYCHGKQLDSISIMSNLCEIAENVNKFANDELDLTMEDILRRNIDKLKKRYPNGFNTQDSIDRKDLT